MHSERMLIFEPPESKLRRAGVGQYGGLMVGLKRRFHNVLLDADKQTQLDLLLGLKLNEYLPTATYLPYRLDVAVPLDFPESDDEADPVGALDWPPTGNVTPGASVPGPSGEAPTASMAAAALGQGSEPTVPAEPMASATSAPPAPTPAVAPPRAPAAAEAPAS
eukprot:60626-Chlamydomonas_euryale.AAC.1